MALVRRVCSLKTGGQQTIQPETWTVVRFPFDGTAEPYDPDGMHTKLSPPNSSPITVSDPEAGLIWPEHDAWATMQGFMIWQTQSGVASADRFKLARHRFSRDPFGVNDTTATSCCNASPNHSVATSDTVSWNFFVHPGTPISYLVWHDAETPKALTLAEFKMSYLIEVP